MNAEKLIEKGYTDEFLGQVIEHTATAVKALEETLRLELERIDTIPGARVMGKPGRDPWTRDVLYSLRERLATYQHLRRAIHDAEFVK